MSKKLRTVIRTNYKKMLATIKRKPILYISLGAVLLLLIFRKTLIKMAVIITRKPTTAVLDLIKKYEGFYSKAYQDTGGVWTIGYGTIQYANGKKVKQGDTITKIEAENELMSEVIEKTKFINYRLLGLSLTDNQYNAIVSLVYNIGTGAFESSTLLKKIRNNPNDSSIADEFKKWSYDNGKYVQGLNNRRISEAKLYFS